MSTLKKIVIRDKKAAAIRRFHPWVFSGAIAKKDNDIIDGDTVQLVDQKSNYLGIGHYQDASISVRIISFESQIDDQAFWNNRIQAAYQYRKEIGIINQLGTNCYRLIHAEGDNLPGLIIDIYAKTAVVQCHSIGMYQAIDKINQALKNTFKDNLVSVYCKSASTLPSNFAATMEDHYLSGAKTDSIATENGHHFQIDWESGQKTGFFLDQRDNRQLLAQYANGKNVLNAFSYTGGFSIYALKAGAKQVDSVDVSALAISTLEQNLELNEMDKGKHHSYTADVLKYLNDCPMYDLAIVDPPAFAKNIRKRHNAVQGYKRLNAKALKKVNPGGLLATFSCSQVVDKTLFYNTITAAALEANRKVRIMHYLDQGADHPVNIFHPEGGYLKGLLLFVE